MSWRVIIVFAIIIVIIVVLGNTNCQTAKPVPRAKVAATKAVPATMVNEPIADTETASTPAVELTERQKALVKLGFSPTKTHRIAVEKESK